MRPRPSRFSFQGEDHYYQFNSWLFIGAPAWMSQLAALPAEMADPNHLLPCPIMSLQESE
jgi:hypothetical protein